MARCVEFVIWLSCVTWYVAVHHLEGRPLAYLLLATLVVGIVFWIHDKRWVTNKRRAWRAERKTHYGA